MRYDLKKFLFVGLTSEKEAFFKKAQHFGIIHFINSQPTMIKTVSNEAQQISDAIKILRGLPPVEQELLDTYEKGDELSTRIIELKDTIDQLNDDERLLKLEMARVEPFGNFSFDDIRYIEKESNRHIQFFYAKMGLIVPSPEMVYVSSDHGHDYFMTLNKEPRSYDKMVELHIEKPCGEVRHLLSESYKKKHHLEAELKLLAKYNTFLHQALIVKLNLQNLHAAENLVQLPLDGALFAVEGWVPVNKLDQLKTLVEDAHLHVEEIAVEEHDVIPTFLENEGYSRVGEDLVHIYDTPSNTDRDPSLWVLCFFALFFAMIVGDGGYGIIYIIGAMYAYYKFSNVKGLGKRLIKLTMIIGVTCLLWGVATNSFFGISLGIDNPLRKASIVQWLVEKRASYHMEHRDTEYQYWVKKYPQLKDIKNPHEFVAKAGNVHEAGKENYELLDSYSRSVMLELALVIGMVHIIISFLRYIRRNWIGLGWIIVIIGGYLFAPTFLQTTSMFYYVFDLDVIIGGTVGLQLVGLGLLLAVGIAVYKHKILGLFEIMTALQVFSDVLSYLRLFALGLAGAIVGSTINELASGLPLVLSVILIIIAHILNMVLGIMSGVIHGLRLNFLEWYHYSFEGGGKLFQPLSLQKIE